MENGTLSPIYYPRTRAIKWSNRFGGGLGSSSRPCLVKTIRRTLIWHPEQIKVWCSKPRIAAVFSGTTFVRISSASHAVQCITHTPLPSAHLLVASIEHFQRHPEVTRYGDLLFLFDLVVKNNEKPYARTYGPRTSASTRLRKPGAATCSCTVDARLMRGAGCIGMGGLSVSRPSLINTTRCSVTAPARPYNASLSPTRYSGRG